MTGGTHAQDRARYVFWGTYDRSVPRIRLLMAAFSRHGEVLECHWPLWGHARHRANMGVARLLALSLRLLIAYPLLLWRYTRLPLHDAVVVAYPGWLDLPVIAAVARLRGVKVIWDIYLPLHEMLVEDRQLLRAGRLPARLVFQFERSVSRGAHYLLFDTAAHADYFTASYRLPASKAHCVWVGMERQHFGLQPADKARPFSVLFYGNAVPLHGKDVILEAARRLEQSHSHIRFTLIGPAAVNAPGNVEQLPGVPYEALQDTIGRAQLCLGIFGEGAKAERVVPNKVFQILACGRPLITRDSPALRELDLPAGTVRLIPPGDGGKLAEAITDFMERPACEILPVSIDTDRLAAQLAPLIGCVRREA